MKPARLWKPPARPRPSCPCWSWSRSTTRATAWTAPRPPGRGSAHRVGRRGHRRQLLHRPGHGAHRYRGHAHGHHAASGRHAQRRHAARRRGPQYLSLLARIHGQLRAQGHRRRRANRGRLLRHHPQPHSRHAFGHASYRRPGARRSDRRGSGTDHRDASGSPERALPHRGIGRGGQVHHPGGDRAAPRHRLREGNRGRPNPVATWRPRHQRARLPARLGPHERAEPVHSDSAAHQH